jgi:hypothetical protein
MLDLLAVGALEDVGTVIGVNASNLVDGLVADTARFADGNAFSFNTTLLLLGFLLGLFSEMRSGDS